MNTKQHWVLFDDTYVVVIIHDDTRCLTDSFCFKFLLVFNYHLFFVKLFLFNHR